MKKLLTFGSLFGLVLIISNCSSTKKNSFDDMLAILQIDEPIAGVCNNSKIVAILPFPGGSQIKAEPSMTDEEIEKALNEEVVFLKDNPEVEDKGMVGLIVNCKGKMVQCKIDNKTQNPELDKQIVAIFSRLEKWKPGTVKGKPIDTSVLYSFTIKDGKITL